MEWPRGVNFPDAGGGDPLCTLLYIEQTDHVQFGSRSKGYMRDSLLNQVDTSHTGRTVQARAPLVYM